MYMYTHKGGRLENALSLWSPVGKSKLYSSLLNLPLPFPQEVTYRLPLGQGLCLGVKRSVEALNRGPRPFRQRILMSLDPEHNL